MMWVWSRRLCKWIAWQGSRAKWLALPTVVAAGAGCLPIPGPMPLYPPAAPVPAAAPPPAPVAVYTPSPWWYAPPPGVWGGYGAGPGGGWQPVGYTPTIPPWYGGSGSGFAPPPSGSSVPPSGVSPPVSVPPTEVPAPSGLPVLATAAAMLVAVRAKKCS